MKKTANMEQTKTSESSNSNQTSATSNDQGVATKVAASTSQSLKDLADFSPKIPLTFVLATRKAIRTKNSW